jgi:hypothetical protein
MVPDGAGVRTLVAIMVAAGRRGDEDAEAGRRATAIHVAWSAPQDARRGAIAVLGFRELQAATSRTYPS